MLSASRSSKWRKWRSHHQSIQAGTWLGSVVNSHLLGCNHLEDILFLDSSAACWALLSRGVEVEYYNVDISAICFPFVGPPLYSCDFNKKQQQDDTVQFGHAYVPTPLGQDVIDLQGYVNNHQRHLVTASHLR